MGSSVSSLRPNKEKVHPALNADHDGRGTADKIRDETVADAERNGSLGIVKLRNLNPVKIDVDPVMVLQMEQALDRSSKASRENRSPFDDAAIKLQKVYRSYRTRRNLADCAVIAEELWWKALDFAALRRSSVSFFNGEKTETATSRWIRASRRAAKVGKGLCQDENAQKLALQHWLEAIDPRHRYGHNLHLYYVVWSKSESFQPFFYWLDIGEGKATNLDSCPRTDLNRQCIRYLGPNEREAYEIVIKGGKMMYRRTGELIHTSDKSKWIFVLSTTRVLYVGEKQKGGFQHSSFLAGGAITSAGRLVAHEGVLKAVWPYSGHYHPTEDNFRELITFLEKHRVDLSHVKRYAIDEDEPRAGMHMRITDTKNAQESCVDLENAESTLPCRWVNGTRSRIECVREYPLEMQLQALQQVKLSPRENGAISCHGQIPSPRPSSTLRLSPKLVHMAMSTPRCRVPSTY